MNKYLVEYVNYRHFINEEDENDFVINLAIEKYKELKEFY